MSIQLEAIKFNHDPNGASVDALNIRRNASTFVTIPEWQRNVSVNPEDSPAAYSIKETAGQTITIQAQFRRLNPQIQSVDIRALDNQVIPNQLGCLGLIAYLLGVLWKALFGNVLGEVQARTVTFNADLSAFETFQLKNTKLASNAVSKRTTEWQWQYKLPNSNTWTNFQLSRHRVYVLLETPKPPWQQAPYNSGNVQLPWTEVLDYACEWSGLAQTRDDAAARITQRVYELAPSLIEYDCPGGGGTRYASPNFDCTAFLERVKGGPGRGKYVNCSDCAAFVSTFANAVGCDLWQSRMYNQQWSTFFLNEILGIGSNVWQTACGWPGFSYHEVAWKGACDVNDEVFDACLQVDGDIDPLTAPHTALLPTNLVFGTPGSGQYRDRLCTVAGRPLCPAQPGSRQRRSVY